MKLIDPFDAAHMTDVQFIDACWEKGFTHQDYLTNCEMLDRSPVSKEVFRSLYKSFEMQAIATQMR